MTRINCIPVTELTDLHLLAEYRELPRISALAHKYVGMKVPMPERYILGNGHVKFFYARGEYLRRRFELEIVPELLRRGFKPNFNKYRMHPAGMNNDWQPLDVDMDINRARITERLRGNKYV